MNTSYCRTAPTNFVTPRTVGIVGGGLIVLLGCQNAAPLSPPDR